MDQVVDRKLSRFREYYDDINRKETSGQLFDFPCVFAVDHEQSFNHREGQRDRGEPEILTQSVGDN